MKAVFFLVGLSASVLAGCNSAGGDTSVRIAEQNKVQDAISQLRNRWFSCAERSFAVQKTLTTDRNAAGEMALVACRTEEEAFFNAAVLLTNNGSQTTAAHAQFAQQIFPQVRAQLKQRLISS